MLLAISIPSNKEATSLPQQLTSLNKPPGIDQTQSKQNIRLGLLLKTIILLKALGDIQQKS